MGCQRRKREAISPIFNCDAVQLMDSSSEKWLGREVEIVKCIEPNSGSSVALLWLDFLSSYTAGFWGYFWNWCHFLS